MKIITLEEHFSMPQIREAWKTANPQIEALYSENVYSLLEDFGEKRIAYMDDMGVDVQVLSLATPGLEIVSEVEAVGFAIQCNNLVAKTVSSNPDRFQAFATIATQSPRDAVSELKRSVLELGFPALLINGRVGDRNIDHPDFLPIFETAAQLKIPVYIHPSHPPQVVKDACYSGFNPFVDAVFAGPAFGWHAETGIQATRLILSGLFDKLPDLQIILGHWGEVFFSYIERINEMLNIATKGKLERPVIDYFKQNFYLTPSGMFYDRMMRDAIEIVGIDRILYAVDYPFVLPADGAPRKFLEKAELSAIDKQKIGHLNWERLTKK